MIRCAVLDDYQRVARDFADWSRLAGRVDVRFLHRHLDGHDEIVRGIGDCEVVVAMRERTPFPRALLERLPRLRLLVTTGRANASIDVAAAAELGIVVCATASHGSGTPELTWALILGLARHVTLENGHFRSGGPWQSTVGTDLAGSVLGIVGLGNIGTQVARVGQAFGMRVTAWSEHLTDERCAAAGVERAGSLDALMAAADVVTIHTVLGPRTRGLIGDAQLRRMKPSALLVNTSRGPIVDEAALLAALAERRIAGAGLDVYDVEPLPPEHPLRRLDNVLALPHLGYVTRNTYALLYGGALEDIVAWLDGAPIRVLTPPGRGPGDAAPRSAPARS